MRWGTRMSTDRLIEGVLASLDGNVALLDKSGRIVAVNDAWVRFGRDNEARLPAIGVGVNYLDVIRDSGECARAVLHGIDSVLRGSACLFQREYRCEGPGGQRSFLLTVTRWHLPEGGALIVHKDISEYRQMDEVQRIILNSVRAILWAADPETFRATFIDGQIEEILGLPAQAWLDDPELWRSHLHPDDREWVLEFSRTEVSAGRNHEFEYRILAADGRIVWLRDIVSIIMENGKASRLVGVSIDVTEIHHATEAMSLLGSRLLQAQELERMRIARELHDDVSQRLSMLAMDLDHHARNLRASADELRWKLADANDEVVELIGDVHALSHKLHSSKLDSLGLQSAAAELCREVSEKRMVEVEFNSDGVDGSLPGAVSLPLFRILQEALQNAAKHSGSNTIKVSLMSRSGQIELSVQDEGRGFNPQSAQKGPGLGLMSMGERLKPIGGTLVIDSQLERGTTIRARVPMAAAGDAASARR
jgi:PAS domain S-box-containing protein